MERVITENGLYPFSLGSSSSDRTTFVFSDFDPAATVRVVQKVGNELIDLDGSPVSPRDHIVVGHALNQDIFVEVTNFVSDITIVANRNGEPSFYNVLKTIAENSMSPIKTDAPANDQGHWRVTSSTAGTSSWVEDPVKEVSGPGEFHRVEGGWAQVPITATARVSWKTVDSSTIRQLCAADSVPQVITLSHYSDQDPAIGVDLANGVITFLEDFTNMDLLINMQVMRSAQAGTNNWMFYLQSSLDGIVWGDVPDSAHQLTFVNTENNDVQQMAYAVAARSIPAGTRVRFMQISDDASNSVGLYSGKPFANAPVVAGVIISIVGR